MLKLIFKLDRFSREIEYYEKNYDGERCRDKKDKRVLKFLYKEILCDNINHIIFDAFINGKISISFSSSESKMLSYSELKEYLGMTMYLIEKVNVYENENEE